MTAAVTTRFAPSPTGRLHLGNLRTALFNALYAASQGGRFLLRIEDTDAARGSVEHEQTLLDDLRWLGLDWEQGEGIYRQSRQQDFHASCLQRLLDGDQAYPCFCSAEELKLARAGMRAAGEAPRYPGTCAALDEAQREAKRAEGRQPSIRFRVPADREVVFHDLLRGESRFDAARIGDFVIQRSDGSYAFFFANAVDDAAMGVSHVLRGEDHLANTPRQLLLLEALGLTPPRYGHLPLVVAANGQPLSKRRGAPGLDKLRAQGYLPLAVLNYLARLGHHYDSDDLLAREALVSGFEVKRLGKAAGHFDPNQLHYWQKRAVEALDSDAFHEWFGEAAELVPAAKFDDFASAVRPNCTFPADVNYWARALFQEIPEYSEDARIAIDEAGAGFFVQAAQAVESSPDDWVNVIKQATERKGKALFMPLRAALTGQVHGPELARVITLLGADEVVQRLGKQ